MLLLMMMAVLEDIFPLDLCTRSTCHLADTSACISTTSWMQQSGVYRRQKSSRLIVVSGELVALSSLAQHRCRSTAMLEEGLERGARPFELDRVGMELVRH